MAVQTKVTHQDKMRIAVVAKVSLATVERYVDGDTVRPVCAAAIESAALQLDIPLPERVH